jgi:hypothetical protein
MAPSPEEAKALSPEEQLATFIPAEGYQVNLFASERDGVVKPTQFSWDEKGRSTSPAHDYPQSLASVPPADHILSGGHRWRWRADV